MPSQSSKIACSFRIKIDVVQKECLNGARRVAVRYLLKESPSSLFRGILLLLCDEFCILLCRSALHVKKKQAKELTKEAASKGRPRANYTTYWKTALRNPGTGIWHSVAGATLDTCRAYQSSSGQPQACS